MNATFFVFWESELIATLVLVTLREPRLAESASGRGDELRAVSSSPSSTFPFSAADGVTSWVLEETLLSCESASESCCGACGTSIGGKGRDVRSGSGLVDRNDVGVDVRRSGGGHAESGGKSGSFSLSLGLSLL